MSSPLAGLIAKKFIQRRDAKAVQTETGYRPHRSGPSNSDPLIPWSVPDIQAHLDGTQTFGHYLLDADNMAKLFVFDIDLAKSGYTRFLACPEEGRNEDWELATYHDDLRLAWREKERNARPWLMLQLRTVAEFLAMTISRDLEIPTAMAYSGNKGLHVYGFTGPEQAATIREGAQLALGLAADAASVTIQHNEQGNALWVPNAQERVWAPTEDPADDYPLTIEIYPKQDTIAPDRFGNLVRLPLGRNLKSPDRTFFLDQRAPHSKFVPRTDPEALLTSGNPWL